jgi:NADH-quinone oxidoreductase subunit J
MRPESMVEKILFIIFAVLVVLGGVAAITRRNMIHALLSVVFTFVNIAAIYFLTQAYFLAVVQILVYAGAIMVLFLFVLMFLNLRTFQEQKQTHPKQSWAAAILAVAVLAEFVFVLSGITFTSVRGGFSPEAIAAAGGSTRVFSDALFNEQLLPFEVASVVLLVAMVGAVVLVKKEKATSLTLHEWEPGEQSTDTGVVEEEV